MSEKIEPALTAEEWASVKHEAGTLRERLGSRIVEPRQTIAIANDILEQSDPRKITRERVDAMRYGARAIKHAMQREYGPKSDWGDVPLSYDGYADAILSFAAALEAYLPPER